MNFNKDIQNLCIKYVDGIKAEKELYNYINIFDKDLQLYLRNLIKLYIIKSIINFMNCKLNKIFIDFSTIKIENDNYIYIPVIKDNSDNERKNILINIIDNYLLLIIDEIKELFNSIVKIELISIYNYEFKLKFYKK